MSFKKECFAIGYEKTSDIILLKLGSNLLMENIPGKNAHFLKASVHALIFNLHSIKSSRAHL